MAAAREAARWDEVDELALLKAWHERRQARSKAEVLIPSSGSRGVVPGALRTA